MGTIGVFHHLGKDKAGELPATRDTEEISNAATVTYDAAIGAYRVTSFNKKVAGRREEKQGHNELLTARLS